MNRFGPCGRMAASDPPLATADPVATRRPEIYQGRGSLWTARLSACPPTINPMRASSPVAWIAVVTNRAPEGAPMGLGGGPSDGFGRSSGGHPAVTATGLLRFGAGALARGGLGFAGRGPRGIAAAALTSRRVRPMRSGRVAERLPRTPSCSPRDRPVDFPRSSAIGA
jgi:hypothetical protein